MTLTSFKGLLFVQDKCEPCHRTIAALSDAFDKSDYIEITAYKDRDGNKTAEAQKYKVDATPTLILVRPCGSELARIKGSSKLPAVVLSRVARYLNQVNEKERVTSA